MQKPLSEIGTEVAKVKEELAEARMERDFLKKQQHTLQRSCGKYAFMRGMRLQYSIPFMSRVLRVSASGYYAWLKRKPSKRQQEQTRLEIEIKAAHKRTGETFGPERLQKELLLNGIKAGICRIRRIRKRLGLYCRQKKRSLRQRQIQGICCLLPTTCWGRDFDIAKSSMGDRHHPYIPTEEGWVYLAGHKDIHTKEIVGFAMGSRMTMELVNESIYRAKAMKQLDSGLIHHSDRGKK